MSLDWCPSKRRITRLVAFKYSNKAKVTAASDLYSLFSRKYDIFLCSQEKTIHLKYGGTSLSKWYIKISRRLMSFLL